MPQNKANQWIHALLPVLQTTMRGLGDAPARTMEELAQRLNQNVTPESASIVPNATFASPDLLPQTSNVPETAIEQEKHEVASPPLFAADWNRKTHPAS